MHVHKIREDETVGTSWKDAINKKSEEEYEMECYISDIQRTSKQ